MSSVASSSSSSSSGTRPRQHRCDICGKSFDSIETLNSHKRLDHGCSSDSGGTAPQPPAGVG
jgi:C2H2-type zinc finger